MANVIQMGDSEKDDSEYDIPPPGPHFTPGQVTRKQSFKASNRAQPTGEREPGANVGLEDLTYGLNTHFGIGRGEENEHEIYVLVEILSSAIRSGKDEITWHEVKLIVNDLKHRENLSKYIKDRYNVTAEFDESKLNTLCTDLLDSEDCDIKFSNWYDDLRQKISGPAEGDKQGRKWFVARPSKRARTDNSEEFKIVLSLRPT